MESRLRPGFAYDGCMDAPQPNIIFIHGNNSGNEPGGAAHDYWFPYAARECTKLGLPVTAKNFPDPMLARQDIWLPFLMQECGANAQSILIGHSSGAIATMRCAEHHSILGSVLVGAYHTHLGDENERLSGYFDAPWDWQSIRANQRWIIQFASVDDPYFPIAEPRFVSEKLGTEYYEYTDKGHFFQDTFPELIDAVMRKLA